MKDSPIAFLSNEGYLREKCGFKPPKSRNKPEFEESSQRPQGPLKFEKSWQKLLFKNNSDDFDSSFDWRNIGAVSSVKDQGEWFFHKFFQPIIHHPKAPVASAGHSPPPLVSSLTSSSLTTKRNRSQQNNSWIAQNEALKAPMADGWTAPMRTWWTTKASTPMRSTGTKRNSSPARTIRELRWDSQRAT